VHASSVQSSLPLVATHNGSARASSLELEDLIAEGKAAASLPNTRTEKIRPATQQHQRHGDLQQVGPGDVSEVGEIRDPSSGHEQEATNHQATLSTDHFAADEIDEIDLWLAMTGYYDKHYRDKVLTRRRRLQEIELERLRLLEEEQEDQRLRGHAHSATPIHASQRLNPLAVAMRPPPSTPNQDLGLRIKDFASKKIITPEDIKSSDNVPLKRSVEDETTDTDTIHQTKVARTEVHRRTPPRSHLATPQTRHRSASPIRNKKQLERPPRSQSPHSRDVYDRWQPDREADRRGATDRLLEEHAGGNDSRGRYDQRRDSGFSTSHPAKQDVQDGPVRFFLLKSWNYENIATAQREGTWATQTKNEDTFVEAFKTCSHVIFFFSANHSKAFQGYARMQGLPGERGVNQPSWVKNLHWPTTAPFKLRWIVKEETPYRAVGNLKNPLNENLAIFVGRDGQEIPEKLGHQLCDIIDEDTSYRADLRR
jgi:YTH domain-containing protein 1